MRICIHHWNLEKITINKIVNFFSPKIFILMNFRLELIRSYVDLGNAKVKREPDMALSLWRRSMSIWEV